MCKNNLAVGMRPRAGELAPTAGYGRAYSPHLGFGGGITRRGTGWRRPASRRPFSGRLCDPALPAADGTVLHSPLSQFHPSLRQVFDALAPGQLVLAGMADPGLKALAQEHGVCLLDYFTREELAVANAVPTAEGAIQIAMEQLPITLHGAQVLVLGFGRIGQATALRLAALGAEVTVAARRWEALAWAKAVGCKGVLLSQLTESPCPFQLVVNTVPALVLGREVLKALPAGCLILDLASKPGGVDRTAAQELGLPVIHALSLPGKVAPVTAAAILQTTIYHMLQELEQPGKEDAT